MTNNILIKELSRKELPEALSLVWEVFLEYEAPDYPKEGVDEFYKSIHDQDYLSRLRVYGAFLEDDLVGMIAVRNEGTHIALFFVKGRWHRQGIGMELFRAVIRQNTSGNMTVNASPYAVPVYHKLGFYDTDVEQNVNGIRFTPMELCWKTSCRNSKESRETSF
ncbi:MAG: GNAT family N-acetyltransferase [Lachnospiraceae bacterium]|nr:GNAT family N-acetyltransferase [Lachnospiraceae bacterium]